MKRKRVIRWIKRGVGVGFALLVVVLFLLQLASVQQWAMQKTTGWLSQKLGATVKAESFRCRHFSQLTLTNFLLEDPQQDTLLAIESLSLKLSPWQLLRRKIAIDTLWLSGFKANIQKRPGGDWNFDFISAAFGSAAPAAETTTPPSSWTLRPGRIYLDDICLNYADAITSSHLLLKLKRSATHINQFDLNKQKISISSLNMIEPLVQYDLGTAKSTTDSTPFSWAFPDLGWRIQVDSTQLAGGQVRYRQSGNDITPTKEGFDPSHIAISDLHYKGGKLLLTDAHMEARVHAFSFQEPSGFGIEHFSTHLVFSDTLTSLRDFSLRTADSYIQQTIHLQYPALESLALLTKPVSAYQASAIRIKASIAAFFVTPALINYFSPGSIPKPVKDGFALQGELAGDLSALNIKQFKVTQGAHFLLSLQGKLKPLLYANEAHSDIKIKTLRTSYGHLYPWLGKQLPKGLEAWRDIELSGKVAGGLDRFQIQHLFIKADNGPVLRGELGVSNFLTYPNSQVRFTLDSLQTKVQDWQGFLAEEQLEQLQAFGNLQLTGQMEGTPYRFHADAQLLTDLGRLATKGDFDFEKDYVNASYKTSLQLRDFDVGTLIQDSLLQPVHLDVVADGQGLSPADWDTQVKATLTHLGYRQYAYDTLWLDGQLVNAALNGRILMQDPHLQFQSEALIELGDAPRIPQFKLALDTVNLQELGFSNTPLSYKFQATGDLQNYQLDSLMGQLLISHFVVQDSFSRYSTDQISVSSEVDEQGTKQLMVDSDFLALEVTGNYTPSTLPKQLLTWVNQYFAMDEVPITPDSLFSSKSSYLSPETTIKASLRMGDPTPLTKIFLPALQQLDTFAVDAAFNQEADLLHVRAYLPTLAYGDYRIDSVHFNSIADELEMKHQLEASYLQLGSNTKIPGIALRVRIKEDSLQFNLISADSSQTPIWNIGGGMKSTKQGLVGKINPDLRLNGEQWAVAPNHDVWLTKEGAWIIEQLRFKKDQELIQLDARINPQDSSGNATLVLEQFEIGALNPFLDLPPGYISGKLQGKLEAKDLLRKSHYVVGLDLRDWRVDTVQMGDAQLQAQQSLQRPEIVLSAALKGENNQAQLEGTYHILQQYFDVEATIPKLSMQTLDPFLAGLIKQSKGYLNGTFTLKGQVEQPSLKGALTFNEVQTTLAMSNTAYQIQNGEIRFDESLIELDNIQMTDARQAQAKLDGRIKHRFFDQISMDLQFDSDRFQFLNTGPEDNDLFYGQLFLQSSVNINGPLEQARFFINAKTQEGTHLYVLPLSDEQAITEDDFIVFGQPSLDSLGRDTSQLDNYQVSAKGIALQLNLETTPEATLEVIVDPLSGDRLVCSGRSNLTVEMDPAGNVAINGSYQISEGQYTFSYEQLLKREFKILPDSKISFAGDPLQATLDITTTYETRVPLRELVLDQISENTSLVDNQRTTVQVQMRITGSLVKPVLSFDIILPNNAQSTLLNAARARLTQVRNDETALNTQVFGLLLFNSFISTQGMIPSLSDTGESVLLSSVSNLISSQLNRLASQLLKGFDLNLGVQAYRPGISEGSSEIMTEVQLGVSKRLFNDRLNVKAGGNVNVGVNNQENQALTAFTGDFALEYRLTPSGNYVLRVYRRSDYDALNEGNVSRTGAGISLKKSLPNKLKRRKQ